MATLTLDWLHEQEACEGQIAIVADEWGESHEITQQTLQRAVELELDLAWLAEKILNCSDWLVYIRTMTEARHACKGAPVGTPCVCHRAREKALWTALQAQEKKP